MDNFKKLQEEQYGWRAADERDWWCVLSREGDRIGQLRIFFTARTLVSH